MQARLTILVARRWIDTAIEKKLSRAGAAVSAGVQECRLDLLLIRTRHQRIAFVEIGPERREPAQRSRAFQVQGRAKIGKEPGRLGLSIGEAGVHDALVVPARRTVVPARASTDQCPKEIDLHAGPLRMHAGSD